MGELGAACSREGKRLRLASSSRTSISPRCLGYSAFDPFLLFSVECKSRANPPRMFLACARGPAVLARSSVVCVSVAPSISLRCLGCSAVDRFLLFCNRICRLPCKSRANPPRMFLACARGRGLELGRLHVRRSVNFASMPRMFCRRSVLIILQSDLSMFAGAWWLPPRPSTMSTLLQGNW